MGAVDSLLVESSPITRRAWHKTKEQPGTMHHATPAVFDWLTPRTDSFVTLRDTSEIEPAYWRCSNPSCNPDGEQGWLRPIPHTTVLEQTRLPGLRSTQIKNRYRSRLGFLEEHPPSGPPAPLNGSVPMPASEPVPVLDYASPPPSAPPCQCMQNHTSIVYNTYKQPIGLVGGLSLQPERLRAAGWSCGAHYAELPPRSLDPAEGGCPRCPLERQLTGPTTECFVVNAWGELLLFVDPERYVDAAAWLDQPHLQLQLQLPPAALAVTLPYVGAYPHEARGPLSDHLQHLAGLQQLLVVARPAGKFVRRLARLLPVEMAGRLQAILAEDARYLLLRRVIQVADFREAWYALRFRRFEWDLPSPGPEDGE
ncbi:0a0ebf44-08e6-41f7-bd46-cebe314611b9 [Thermothielavioides terrestris]|uniref:0a0ebf44-08e6-41f7-bd46-cebe314611b9 n=1 Tax=Thermothielavioides terrestris TaxID=2587410 RepID=A0A446BP33_9PEZI|nr:0a0ebf44-08e6-41f7-bd46-cebe314611b9 [Thermothielavioides terrestris]